MTFNAASPFAPRVLPELCSADSTAGQLVCTASSYIFSIATGVRAFTVVAAITAHIGYEFYARAAEDRWAQSDRLGKRPADVSKRVLPWALLDAVSIPVGILFSIVPALYVQVLLIFTDRLQYIVALKPVALVPIDKV